MKSSINTHRWCVVNEEGITPLMLAASNALPNTMRQLVGRGANTHDRDGCGNTALHWAACAWEQLAEDCVAFLIDQGAEIDAINDKGQTPLLACLSREPVGPDCGVDSGHEEIIGALLARGASLDVIKASGVDVLELLISTQDRFSPEAFVHSFHPGKLSHARRHPPQGVQSSRRL